MKSRRILAASLLALSLGLAASSGAMAQSQPGDPPGLVGRLAEVSGSVSFHTADANQWQAATLNYPVTSGNSFWTEPRSHAAIDVGAARIYLDSATELDFSNVADQSVVASLAQGAVYLRLAAADGNQYEIDTPRGAVHIVQPGSYEIVAGDGNHPTTLTTFEGTAQILGPEANATAGPQQAVAISGQNPAAVTVNPAVSDDFVRFVQAEEQPYQNAGPAAQYVSPDVTGYEDLNRYGQWRQTPDYGAVWAPQVADGWAPYRDGRWAYVAPWGWTWIDDAPWGFAPFHYGRWVQIASQWCWTPGSFADRPVYAPALVSFFGGFDVGGIGISLGFGPAVGWVPLGPDEVYVPSYRSSPRYIRNLNITNVRNETTIINVVNNNTVINNYNSYRNRNGATVVQADAMTGSLPIGPAYNKLTPDQRNQFDRRWSQANVGGNNAPVKPTWNTTGVTPGLAQQLGIQPPVGAQNNNRPAAPGPNGPASGKWQLANGGHGPAQIIGADGPTAQPQGQPNWQPTSPLKAQIKGPSQPQGQGLGFASGSNFKLPPVLAGQAPSSSKRFVSGQMPAKAPRTEISATGPMGQQPFPHQSAQSGNQNWASQPQWQQPQNTQRSSQYGPGRQTQASIPQWQQLKPQKNGQNGNLTKVATPQWQQPQNAQRNSQSGNGKQIQAAIPQWQQPKLQHNTGGQSNQKVRQNQQIANGAVPFYDKNGKLHTN